MKEGLVLYLELPQVGLRRTASTHQPMFDPLGHQGPTSCGGARKVGILVHPIVVLVHPKTVVHWISVPSSCWVVRFVCTAIQLLVGSSLCLYQVL